ncbi:AAA family ATPase [Mycolicibacter senuensis]|uniref:AAA family ATPase n=1 Tax=Mycolicibacter senuensis TaxID=386913 RepID=UPI00105688E5|nr:ATP-binding protein [Mycolicibacter senuensis]
MGGRWPLMGRGEELRLIGDALADSELRGVLIAGRAGVGKSRLASEAAEIMAASGWAVSRLAGTASGRSVPLGPFAAWVDDFDASPLAITRQILTALRAGAGGAPLLVVVDDAHLLDDLLALVVNQLVAQHVAEVLATVRTGEAAPDAVSTLWKDGALRRVELQPLSRPESEELLAVVLGELTPACAERMWRLTRGNALYLHHLVEQEREAGRLVCEAGRWTWATGLSVSPTLVELVELQIGKVADDLRDVVDLVAIAEPIDRACLASLASPQAIEAAEERGLIKVSPSADMIRVGHPLYGEVRLNQCGPLRLRRLRGEIATVMAREPARADPLRLGLLWLESDLPADPVVLVRAATVARSRLDLALAERLARAAADASPNPVTKLLLAYVLFMRENGPETEEVLAGIDDNDLPAAGFVSPTILRSANLLWVLRRPDQAWQVLEDALRGGDPDRAVSLRTFCGVLLVLAGKPADALAALSDGDIDRLDQFGKTLGRCAQTIALGDLGRIAEAGQQAGLGYDVIAESPQGEFQRQWPERVPLLCAAGRRPHQGGVGRRRSPPPALRRHARDGERDGRRGGGHDRARWRGAACRPAPARWGCRRNRQLWRDQRDLLPVQDPAHRGVGPQWSSRCRRRRVAGHPRQPPPRLYLCGVGSAARRRVGVGGARPSRRGARNRSRRCAVRP